MQPSANDSAGRELAKDVVTASDSGAPNRHFDTSDATQTKHGKAGGNAEWLTPVRFACILAACIFAAYPEVVLGTRTFFYRDFGYFGYPLAFHHRESFWRGEVPLWNPLSDCGLPFLAQWNTLVLYPGSFVYLLLPLSWALGLFCLLHQWLGGLGMYLLAARWTRNRFAAGVAGMVFAFNGLALNSLMWPNNIAALGWMPWVVWQMERAWNEGGRRTGLAAVFGAMQMLAGAPEIILVTWAVLAVMLFVQVVSEPNQRVRFANRFFWVVLLVTGLAAAQLGPFLDLLAHSQRNSSFAQSSWSMPGTGWANFFVPLFHCFSSPANQGVFFQYDQWWTSSYYVGVGPLVLAILAAVRVRKQRVWMLASLAVLSLVFALGDHGYVYLWLRHAAPQFGLLRYPIKFVVLAIFCFPLLTAYAIQWLQPRATAHVASVIRMLVISWAGSLAVMGTILWLAHRYPFQWDEWPATWHNGLIRAAFVTGFLTLLVASLRLERFRLRALVQIALLFLMWLDVLTHAPQQNPTVQRLAFRPGVVELSPAPVHGVSRAMISAAADAKFRSIAAPKPLDHYLGTRLGLFSNCNLLDSIPKVNGFFSLYLRETDQICAMLYGSQPADLPRLLDFLGVSHITEPGKLFDWSRRTNYLSFVSAGQQPAFAEGTEVLRALASADFNSRQVAYLAAEAKPFITARASSARIQEARFSAHRDEWTVESADPTLVIISQSYYHFWRAFVDGQPTRLWRVNHAFQAVQVPSGRHRIHLIYRDPFFCFGTLVAVVSLLACSNRFWKRASAVGGARPSDEFQAR